MSEPVSEYEFYEDEKKCADQLWVDHLQNQSNSLWCGDCSGYHSENPESEGTESEETSEQRDPDICEECGMYFCSVGTRGPEWTEEEPEERELALKSARREYYRALDLAWRYGRNKPRSWKPCR